MSCSLALPHILHTRQLQATQIWDGARSSSRTRPRTATREEGTPRRPCRPSTPRTGRRRPSPSHTPTPQLAPPGSIINPRTQRPPPAPTARPPARSAPPARCPCPRPLRTPRLRCAHAPRLPCILYLYMRLSMCMLGATQTPRLCSTYCPHILQASSAASPSTWYGAAAAWKGHMVGV